MINRASYFLNQKLMIIIFIFCILIACFSFIKINSNMIIFSEVDIYQDINIESIMYTCEKYDMAIYYPATKSKKINKEIKSVVDIYINNLINETKYFIPQKYDDKINLLIEYKIERINKDIVSFVFFVNYSEGKSTIDNDIITMTYNLKSGRKLKLNNFFDETTNYTYELSDISKESLLKRNDIDQKNLNWFIDDINNSLQNSFDSYSFSYKYLSIYFNGNKISSKCNYIYEIKIPWDRVKHLLKKNVYINGISEDISQAVFNVHDEDKDEDENNLYFPAFNINISNTDKVIALTFDDGPHNIYTDKILKHLGKNNIVATFFVLGNRIEYNKELLKRMVDLGCEIGNHSLSHKNFANISDQELKNQVESVNNSIKTITGYDIRAVRPPYGISNSKIKKLINKPIVLWNIDPEDWKFKDSLKIRDHVLSKVENGSIILLHDIYESSADASIMIIDELLKQGYKFVTVSQLLQLEDENTNGMVFTHKK